MAKSDCQLLCTFSTFRTYQKEIALIQDFYEIDGGRIYILSSSENPDDVFLTYNVYGKSDKFYPKTISVHRKKDVNILYSINALNELVKMENNGRFDPSFKIDWQKYSNSIIVVAEGKLKVTKTKLLTIFFLK